MSSISLLPGFVLITRDPIQRSSGYVLYPDQSPRVACSGLALLHEPGNYWFHWEGGDAIPLTNRRVYFEKWSGRPFMYTDLEFWVIPEASILAVEDENVQGGKQ